MTMYMYVHHALCGLLAANDGNPVLIQWLRSSGLMAQQLMASHILLSGPMVETSRAIEVSSKFQVV